MQYDDIILKLIEVQLEISLYTPSLIIGNFLVIFVYTILTFAAHKGVIPPLFY